MAALDLSQRLCSQELVRLITTITASSTGQQQLAAVGSEVLNSGKSAQTLRQLSSDCSFAEQLTAESRALQFFSVCHRDQRLFSNSALQDCFAQLFVQIMKHKLCKIAWLKKASEGSLLPVLTAVRILMRDAVYRKQTFMMGGVQTLSWQLKRATSDYMKNSELPHCGSILKELTNIFQKLSTVEGCKEELVSNCAHESLVLLLSSADAMVVRCCLVALCNLAHSPRPRSLIGELNCIEKLLTILCDYDNTSKRLAANLLRALCADLPALDMIKQCYGIPLLLSLLQRGENTRMLHSLAYCVGQLTKDADANDDLRHSGAVPALLSLLRVSPYDMRTSSKLKGDRCAPSIDTEHSRTGVSLEESQVTETRTVEQLQLKSACCTALAELVKNDRSAQQVVRANGIYLIATAMLMQPLPFLADQVYNSAVEQLQLTAARALRYLFSVERNRRAFHRLLPTELFIEFINVGHYVKEISAYKPVVTMLNSFPEGVLGSMRESVRLCDQSRPPTHHVADYAVLELLGSGAFGCVYRVCERSSASTAACFALKEISNGGGDGSGWQQDVSELSILKERLRHPNVVQYYKTFVENDKLYILMELIDGAPLGEYFNSLKEKGEKFTEDRIWTIFIQMVLALRYLHKEKGIIHRDLTPNNIMLGENDKVTITDFGLAKQQHEGWLHSAVGTVLYCCPEIIQSLPYGEKADIWAVGCILYQMCTLQPPFHTSNILSLALQIVSGVYEPIAPGDAYSPMLRNTANRCLSVDVDKRPDIIEVGSLVSEKLLLYVERVSQKEASLHKKLEAERRRSERHSIKAESYAQDYRKLFLARSDGGSKEEQEVKAGLDGADLDIGDDCVFESEVMLTQLTRRRRVSGEEGEGDSPGAVQEHVAAKRWQSWSREVGGTSARGTHSQAADLSLANAECSPDAGKMVHSSIYQSHPHIHAALPPAHATPQTKGRVLTVDARTEESNLQKRSTGKTRCHSLYILPPGEPGRPVHSLLPLPPPKTFSKKSQGTQMPGLSSMHQLQRRQDDSSGFSSGDSFSAADDTLETTSSSQSSTPNALAMSPSALCQGVFSIDKHRENLGAKSPATRHRKFSSCIAAAKLTISPRRVRQIEDPLQKILNALHKIVYVTQLPPSLQYCSRRHIVEKFKRSLFTPRSSSHLKSELKKIITGSRDVIDFVVDEARASDSTPISAVGCMANHAGASHTHATYLSDNDDTITYERMQSTVEDVLVESGYYDLSRHFHRRRHKLLVTAATAAHWCREA